MTRKDFIAVAKIINNAYKDFDGILPDATHQIARELAKYFKQQNSNFDTQRFLDACEGK